jgi:UPF0755 protein
VRSCWSILLGLLLILGISVAVLTAIPLLARGAYGPPARWLTLPQMVDYSVRLLLADGRLSTPRDARASEMDFEVQPGESIASVCSRLEQQGIVAEGSGLRDYLIYTGQDVSLQAGQYRLSAAMSPIDIARRMQDATPADVEFVVLAGWRIEEIAAALPTSGLVVEPREFIRAAHSPRAGFDFLEGAGTLEGFLYPDTYILPRNAAANDVLAAMVEDFSQHLGAELRQEIAAQGLSVREAVTLASIVQREAVHLDEAPLIASVYLNRLNDGMRLDADPTVQYALGFDADQQTWWTNPLSLDDLKVDSPYNTYLIGGLPPSPISNPGLEALQAIAQPAASPYYYFSARCDDSGYHIFSKDFQEHLANLCQ